MSDTMARTRLLIGSTQEWIDADIVCGDGELVLERAPGNTARAKVGDGVSKFSSLHYLMGAPSATSLLYRGARDFTAAAPSAPVAGDMWANTASGTVHASWTGIGGQQTLQYELAAFDGTRWDIVGSADPVLRVDLTNVTDPTKAAGQVALNPQLTYPNGSLGAHDSDTVRVVDYPYLARGAGATDDTAAIQAAITWAGAAYDADWFTATLYTRPRIVELSHTHKILGKLLIPRGVIVRGNNTTLIGSGSGAGDNICFESAWFNGGVLTSNIGTVNETHRVQYARIESIKFVNFKLAVNVFNFNEGSAVCDCSFTNCGQAVIAERCWYGQFYDLMSRGSANNSPLPCFEFRQYVNVQRIENIYVQGRTGPGAWAYLFAGAVNGQSIRSCGAETCSNGMKFTGEVNPVNIDSCYFENIAGTAIDFMTAVSHRAVTIDNNWFQIVGTGIAGVQMQGGRIGAGNYFLTTTNPVQIQDNPSNITVEIRGTRTSVAGKPVLAAGFALGPSVRVIQPVQVFDNSSGVTTACQDYTGGLVPLPFAGQQASPSANTVPFCTHSKTAGTTFDVILDTAIVFDTWTMYVFSLTFTDNGGTYTVNGRGYGTAVFLETGTTKTCVASNNSGFLRLQFTSFTHPAQSYSCRGVARMA
jgi:hypothetical protein